MPAGVAALVRGLPPHRGATAVAGGESADGGLAGGRGLGVGRESAVMGATVVAVPGLGPLPGWACRLTRPTAYGLLCRQWTARNQSPVLRVGRSALVFAQHRLLAMPPPSRRLRFGERWSSTKEPQVPHVAGRRGRTLRSLADPWDRVASRSAHPGPPRRRSHRPGRGSACGCCPPATPSSSRAPQRRSSWLDEASASPAAHVPPPVVSGVPATSTTRASSRCSPAPCGRWRPAPSEGR